MTQSRPCPACRGRDSHAFGVVHGFAMRACGGCGTLFTASLPSAEQAKDYEDYYDAGNLTVPEFVDERLGQIVGTFEGYRRSNRWLDVGCGAGALMRAAARHGWTVTGTEIAPKPVEELRAAGFDVRLGGLAELDLPPGGFDVVSLVEVLEHVPDPDAELAASAALIRPGGALYVTTPHGRGLSARLLGERWSVVAPPEHLQLYSAPGLRSAVRRAGLRESTLRTHAVDPRSVMMALRRRDGAPSTDEPDARVERTYKLNESLSSRRTGVVAKRAANAALSVTRLGDGLKLVAERRAGA